MSHRGSRIYNIRTLQGTDFTNANQYEHIPLPFELQGNVEDLETRVYVHNVTDVIVKKISIEPDIAEKYYDTGLLALQKGKTKKARRLFSKAIAASTHPRALYQIGLLEQSIEKWDESIPYLQEAIAHEPEFADAYYRLGLAFQHAGQTTQARKRFDDATESLPTHLDAWKALSALYRNAGQADQEEAINHTLSDFYAPQYPYAINFGHQIMFMGYSIDNSVHGKLHIEYYWKALNDISSNYVIFAHFTSSDHKFQHDHLPSTLNKVSGDDQTYPTHQWKIGELIKETFELEAPTGTFQIELGIWEPEFTRKRLPIIPSTNTPQLWKQTALSLKNITVR